MSHNPGWSKWENFLPRLAMTNRILHVLRAQPNSTAHARLFSQTSRSTNSEPENPGDMAVESTSTTNGAVQPEHHVLETGVGSGDPGDLELMDEDVSCLNNNVTSDDILARDKCEEARLGGSSFDNDPDNTNSEGITTCHKCGFKGKGGESWCLGCAIEEWHRGD